MAPIDDGIIFEQQPTKKKTGIEKLGEDMLICHDCGFMFSESDEDKVTHELYCKGNCYHCSECGLDFGRGEEEKQKHEEHHYIWLQNCTTYTIKLSARRRRRRLKKSIEVIRL
jgi:transposase-like protein